MSNTDKQASGHSVALAVVALFAGILIGIVAAGVYNVDEQVPIDTTETTGISGAESEFRLALSTQLQQHVDLSATFARSTYEDRGDREAIATVLEENSQDIAATLAIAYGDDFESDFFALWESYVSSYGDYVVAITEDDGNEVAAAESAFEAAGEEVADYLQEQTGAEADVVSEAMDEHTLQLLQLINGYVAGNFSESYDNQRVASAHITAFADTLADTATDDSPARF